MAILGHLQTLIDMSNLSCGLAYECARREGAHKRIREIENESNAQRKRKMSQLEKLEHERTDLLRSYRECIGREYVVGDLASIEAYAFVTGKLAELGVLWTYYEKIEREEAQLREIEKEAERTQLRQHQEDAFRRSREVVMERLAQIVKDPVRMEQIQMNSITRRVGVLAI